MNKLKVIAGAPINEPAEGLTLERLRMILQDSHLNLLIGAGTSSPYFEPLGDIENMLTELGRHMDGEGGSKLAHVSLQAYFFRKVLLPNFPLINREPSAQSVLRSYARFVSVINRLLLKRQSSLLAKQANIFTTNVDMAFEVATEMLEIDTNDGFLGKLRPRLDLGEYGTLRVRQGTHYEYRSQIPVLNILKIHGSAAWQRGGDDIYFDHQLSAITQAKQLLQSAESELLTINDVNEVNTEELLKAANGRRLNDSGMAFAEAYSRLSIINPEKTKFATTVLNKTYYELIRRLANELEKENSVLLVHGFSFRDEHLRDLVLRSARTNPTLQVIVFCYSRGAREDMRLLLSEEQIKNGNILLVAPHQAKEGDERKISLDVLVDDYLVPVLAESPETADHVIELKLTGVGGGSDDV